MSFLERFFAHKSYINKIENEEVVGDQLLNYRPSNLYISKEQIRFLLFRECDRRGRKLLFDSSAVEKTPLHLKCVNFDKKSTLVNAKKSLEYIETTATHGYKYKKLPDDVACLGEMIFGSVAMTYKGENSCKIHKIPSPKKLMFTSIIYAPTRCHIGAANEGSSESSSASLKGSSDQKKTSSSDSKLYAPAEKTEKSPATFPCTKNTLGVNKLIQCCDGIDINECITKESQNLHETCKLECFDSSLVLSGSDNSKCVPVKEYKLNLDKVNLEQDFLILNLSKKNSGCEPHSVANTSSASSIASPDSDNFSSVSGSLSSLRRRWAQSNSTSLDITSQDDLNSAVFRKKTKLGMALLLDISHSNDDEMESFLFNHTILIESIMSKLQSSVELAYIRNQQFVDLLHTAFLDTQQSIHDLVACGKYSVPLWITLNSDSDNAIIDTSKKESGVRDVKFSLKQFTSPKKVKKATESESALNQAKTKFLNDFHEILVKFDTKDTNFFISTLLTAVLTHHLSWVTSIAENDVSNQHEKIQSVIKNYNPIWAQLNDLCGLLGSPLKCAKTIVKGKEDKRFHIAAILQVLTYFIRCFSVIENVFDVDIEEIVGDVENSPEVAKFRGTSAKSNNNSNGGNDLNDTVRKSLPLADEAIKNTGDDEAKFSKNLLNLPNNFKPEKTLGRNKNSYTRLNLIDSSDNIYPDLDSLIRDERIHLPDLEYSRNEPKLGEIEDASNFTKSLGNQIYKCHSEGYQSPDEGYDTIDSTKTDSLCAEEVKVEEEPPSQNENIVFLLGDNEKLVKVRKKVVLTVPEVIELETEDSKEVSRCPVEMSKNYPVDYENQSKSDPKSSDESSDEWRVEERLRKARESPSGSLDNFLELPMPRTSKPSRRKLLDVSSVFGGVNTKYNSEQIIQGLIDSEDKWEENLQKDLFFSAYNSTVEKNVSEALCIIGNVDSWEVTVRSSSASAMDRKKVTGVRVGMSQLVADMLESFLYIRKINLSSNFCLLHIEKKLQEIYLKSKTVAELLISTEMCTIDYLTTKLEIGINDIPLLLSVATTHSPQISQKYGLTFT